LSFLAFEKDLANIISVIIPSGRPWRSAPALEALLKQRCEGGSIELIVVIPCGENLPNLPKPIDLSLKVVHTHILYPPGKMRNFGARHALGGYFCFIDDDCVVPDNWVQKMRAAINTCQRIGAVGCRVGSMGKDFWSRCADFALFADYQYRQPRFCNLGSAALCVRRAAFEDAGGFDEDLKASEDWDFSLKLQVSGWRCLFEPAVEVLHDHRRDGPAKILKSAYRSGKLSGLRVQRRHFEKMSWLAKISLFAGDHHFYAALAFPYAAAVTLQQFFSLRLNGFDAAFLPCMFLAKTAYHIGVLNSGQNQIAG